MTSLRSSPAKDAPELSQAPRSWVSPSLNQHPPPGNSFSLDGNRMLGSLGGRGRRPLGTVMGNSDSQGPIVKPEKRPFP